MTLLWEAGNTQTRQAHEKVAALPLMYYTVSHKH